MILCKKGMSLVTGAMCQSGAGANANELSGKCVKDYGPKVSINDPTEALTEFSRHTQESKQDHLLIK